MYLRNQQTIASFGPPQFSRIRVGINYPWFRYGWDFGEPPIGWRTRALWKTALEADLDYFKCLGIFAVRWFILGSGLNYPSGQRTAEWWMRNSDPPPLTPAFLQDFGDLLNTFWNKGMLLVPSLISRSFFGPSQISNGTQSGGHADIINDTSPYPRWQRFLDRVLEPLLNISAPYHENIYAWELINEPELVTIESSFGNSSSKTVPQATMLRFIREGLGRINAKTGNNGRSLLRSTVGFFSWKTVFPGSLQWRSLGATLHQFHYYASEAEQLPVHSFSPNYPIFIGEFATNPRHRTWPGLGSQDVESRLRFIESKGYPAAFLWSARACDQTVPTATDWSSNVHDLVRRYTGGANYPFCQQRVWNNRIPKTYPLCS
ncbi:MAG: hypothetical protein ONB46_10590 [candidate division KSB1 bacterium]|nr:hypothetical protein [candidate division KSB1 bacterium]MDZ7366252.1 hypothetical protein [candidate division KSB1 bacterium]MDZ7404470.1 hypothetical protein [candidate division KSB1 bacterium]